MVNATWDEPAAAPAVKRAKEHCRQRSQSLKSLLSSPQKTLKPSRNAFQSDKGVDRLLSLLRTQSFCGQPSPEDEHVPSSIVCKMNTVKRAPCTLDERIKRMTMSDSKTSIASTLSDNSGFSLVSLMNDNKTCADSQVPVKRSRKMPKSTETTSLARVHSVQTA